MAHHNDIGSQGEKIAAEYLTSKGYTILSCNWRYKKLEIDLIARKNNFLVLVEVKTRSAEIWGLPEEAVSAKKQEQMRQAAEIYLEQNNSDDEIRFDVVSIIMLPGQTKVNLIEDAFR